ncbi:putative tRNA (cytidine(32)/guanosine(34)-2'-O)-methyltransferase isoform X1 [Schistocerca piceifrons]|uniref:putative tRNA (cytidine(32)/guanosine(34)-2'-O)-methyltransferase isoform X1 n=1 Tax=Schistocerca piceifrons TaxID=274613 RepID=UPI001F5F7179|nr:putative tRNA (cytidine(32)/guanosine(34)-2'-O)-methyltransferase isoform X1 [Schistocerca piceifrons]XP_047119019.1 putative tRNA (cytidine(32)/guanosine(34)-2'-O)-methyltransferase isoform X1 [Schistocerca piceifrons]
MGKRSKDKRDIYYRLAKSDGWRARSAYKLIQIDEKFKILEEVRRVVDLCAAPGSWSQVLSKRLRADDPNTDTKIVAVDLMIMAPIDGVTCICGDITKGETAKEIVNQFDGSLADLVVCDGAPDVSHKSDFDEYVQSYLVLSALNISTLILKPGGTFLAKIFRGKDVNRVYAKLKQFFTEVMCVKPKCCRNSSIEAYVLCKNYSPPVNYEPTTQALLPLKETSDFLTLSQSTNAIVPFICCGEESPYDADMCYPVELDAEGKHVPLPPVQEPISPPYAKYLMMKRNNELPKY